jgi:hypothetical protein
VKVARVIALAEIRGERRGDQSESISWTSWCCGIVDAPIARDLPRLKRYSKSQKKFKARLLLEGDMSYAPLLMMKITR